MEKHRKGFKDLRDFRNNELQIYSFDSDDYDDAEEEMIEDIAEYRLFAQFASEPSIIIDPECADPKDVDHEFSEWEKSTGANSYIMYTSPLCQSFFAVIAINPKNSELYRKNSIVRQDCCTKFDEFFPTFMCLKVTPRYEDDKILFSETSRSSSYKATKAMIGTIKGILKRKGNEKGFSFVEHEGSDAESEGLGFYGLGFYCRFPNNVTSSKYIKNRITILKLNGKKIKDVLSPTDEVSYINSCALLSLDEMRDGIIVEDCFMYAKLNDVGFAVRQHPVILPEFGVEELASLIKAGFKVKKITGEYDWDKMEADFKVADITDTDIIRLL